MEDEQFNCTIIITTPGETDDLNLSSSGEFRVDVSTPDDASWLYADNSVAASNFNYNVSISVTPSKADVGNWTVNFTATDGISTVVSDPPILLYVNYTESNVTMAAISDTTLYQNYTFQVNGVDEDLLILDSTIKEENLTFASNTSWVSIVELGHTSGNNYITANISVDYDHILNLSGEGNYNIKINVTDDIGNVNESVFIIEIVNDTAPEWNASLGSPVNLSLTEGNIFTYNVSVNVSDVDVGDNITFYYENISAEFCSLNSTNFNSTTGIINFTPTDCDVGYHNVTIIASDTKLNSSWSFNFTVSNINDEPSISSFTGTNSTGQSPTLSEGYSLLVTEDSEVVFILDILDEDFLIPSGQRDNFYNESLVVNVTATNSSGSEEDLFNFSFVEAWGSDNQIMRYNASFTPTKADNYTIFVNITDNSSVSINRTFYLNVSEFLSDPNMAEVDNQSLTIYDYLNFTV